MKKETVEAYLKIRNNEPIVTVKGKEGYTNPETLIAYIKKGISSGNMESHTPKSSNGYTKFKFDVYDEKGKLNSFFVVKVSHKERGALRPIMDKINEVSKSRGIVDFINKNRLAAGLVAGAIALCSLSTGIVNILTNVKDNEKANENPRSSISDIYRIEAEKQYYEDLKERALNGDKGAQTEYQNYLIEQELKEQVGLEKSSHYK